MRKLLVVMLAGLFTCGSAYAADTKTDMKKRQERRRAEGVHEDLSFGEAGEEGKQDGDVQQEDRWHERRRASESPERVHEGLTLGS